MQTSQTPLPWGGIISNFPNLQLTIYDTSGVFIVLIAGHTAKREYSQRIIPNGNRPRCLPGGDPLAVSSARPDDGRLFTFKQQYAHYTLTINWFIPETNNLLSMNSPILLRRIPLLRRNLQQRLPRHPSQLQWNLPPFCRNPRSLRGPIKHNARIRVCGCVWSVAGSGTVRDELCARTVEYLGNSETNEAETQWARWWGCGIVDVFRGGGLYLYGAVCGECYWESDCGWYPEFCVWDLCWLWIAFGCYVFDEFVEDGVYAAKLYAVVWAYLYASYDKIKRDESIGDTTADKQRW